MTAVNDVTAEAFMDIVRLRWTVFVMCTSDENSAVDTNSGFQEGDAINKAFKFLSVRVLWTAAFQNDENNKDVVRDDHSST